MSLTSTRLSIAVLFGGRSAEHEVLVLSATNVISVLAPEKYEAIPIFVTRDGRRLWSSFANGALTRPEIGTELSFVLGGRGKMIVIGTDGKISASGRIDLLFHVLHEPYGEEGSVQGLADVARVPLVGCCILGSAAALEKVVAKRLLKAASLRVARLVKIGKGDAPDLSVLESQLGLPLFIKPARQGFSVGVRKVSGSQDFMLALAESFRHVRHLLAEEFIEGREIEFSVLEDPSGGLFVSRPGEIPPAESHGFYSYDAKYIDQDGAALKVPAELPSGLETEMRDMAASACRALGCDGMARIEFFLSVDMKFVVNEVNTVPGFTNICMYPAGMAASGVSCRDLIDRPVAHGLARTEMGG